MTNEISGLNNPLPYQPSSHALTDLANVITEITSFSRGQLLYNTDTMVRHVDALITETTGNLHTWCLEYTPEMQATLTGSCKIIANLAPMVKYSPRSKMYPEAVIQTLANGLDKLCLEFHRKLYHVFKEDYKLPASYIKAEARTTNLQYKRLLADHPDNQLLKAMLRPVHKLMYQPSANNTKERVDYINVLLGNIKLWHRKKGTQEQLYEIALAMNLNCPRILNHIAGDASARILKYNNGTERLEYIEQLNKRFRNALANAQWKSSSHGPYMPHESSVTTTINEWLSHQKELAGEEMKQAAETTPQPEEEGVRLELNEDLSYFSILIRIMVTAGLSKLKKVAPALRAFCRVVSFSKTQNPSSGHMIRIASGRVPDAILDKLEAFFNECQHLIRKIRRNGGKFPDDAG